MKYILLLFIISPFLSFSQKYLDKKITVNRVDTVSLYLRIKHKLVNMGYIVKDDGNTDTITTYPKEKYPLGYIVVRATIDGDKVTFSGFYSKKKFRELGYTYNSNEYKPVIYFEHDAGMGWREIKKIATNFGSDMDYSQ